MIFKSGFLFAIMFTGTSPIVVVHTHYIQDALSYKIWCQIFMPVIHIYVANTLRSGNFQVHT